MCRTQFSQKFSLNGGHARKHKGVDTLLRLRSGKIDPTPYLFEIISLFCTESIAYFVVFVTLPLLLPRALARGSLSRAPAIAMDRRIRSGLGCALLSERHA